MMRWLNKLGLWGLLSAVLISFNMPTQAAPVDITISVRNVSPLSTFAVPAFSGQFHDGSGSHSSQDYFDIGSDFPLTSADATEGFCFFSVDGDCALLNAVASTGDFFGITATEALFSDPDGVAVTDLSDLLRPGEVNMVRVTSDTTLSFFSFFAEILPTNDSFIGTDVPLDITALFGLNVGESLPAISVRLRDIINLGIEGDGVFGGALDTFTFPESGDFEDQPISEGTTDFSVFDGEFTEAGVFDFSALSPDTEILSITLTLSSAAVTPANAPASIGIFGLSLFGMALRYRRRIFTS